MGGLSKADIGDRSQRPVLGQTVAMTHTPTSKADVMMAGGTWFQRSSAMGSSKTATATWPPTVHVAEASKRTPTRTQTPLGHERTSVPTVHGPLALSENVPYSGVISAPVADAVAATRPAHWVPASTPVSVASLMLHTW